MAPCNHVLLATTAIKSIGFSHRDGQSSFPVIDQPNSRGALRSHAALSFDRLYGVVEVVRIGKRYRGKGD